MKNFFTRFLTILLISIMTFTFAQPNRMVSAASGQKTKSVTVNKKITVKTSKKIKKIKMSKKGIVKVTFQKKAKKFKVKGIKKGKVTLTVTYTNKKKTKYYIKVKAAKKSTSANQKDKTTSINREEEVVRLVNKERTKAGLKALTTDATLQKAAAKRAQELTSLFSHSRPDGTRCFTVLDQYHISYMAAGENIAMGQTTPQEVMNGWMNSEGHRANILSGNFTKIGVGVYKYKGRLHWVQLFIGD